MSAFRHVLAVGAVCLLPWTGAAAHPHLFIDTGLSPVYDASGRLVAVRVTWVYDAFYSLMLVEDYGLDPDGDGTLTEGEAAAIAGFDQSPEDGFTGTTTVSLGGVDLPLGPPERPAIALAGGQLASSHLRRLETPVPLGAGPVDLRTYDPTYYAAFTLSLPSRPEGQSPCTSARIEADVAAANAVVERLLANLQGQSFDDDDFPEVGARYADTLRLTCAAPS